VFHRKNRKPWLVTLRLDDVEDFVKAMNGVLERRDSPEEQPEVHKAEIEIATVQPKARLRAKPRARAITE
jgi:hypothetical protein